jgi:very-short-patch-repair endonuclease
VTPLLQRIARRQAGAFTRTQALRCGLSSADINARVLAGDWLAVMRDVLVVAGAPVTPAMKAWTAVLAVRQPVALAGPTAAAWLGLDRVLETDRPQLIVPCNRHLRPLPGVDVRRFVREDWVVQWHNGLPVTPVAMTIRDVAATMGRERARDVVQHALRRRRTTVADLTAQLGRGHFGAARLRSVLEEIGPGYQVVWERMLHRALCQVGIVLQPQVEVRAPDGRTAFIDLGDEELKFGVEIDGFLNHMARFRADRRRARMLALELGWTIAPFTADEIATSLPAVVGEIAAHLRRIGALAA